MLDDCLLLLAGFLVGAMNAIAGGGMFLGFPVIIAFGHVSALIANATANVSVLPGSISSAYGYRKQFKKIPKVFFLLLLPALFGSAIGALLLLHTSANNFESFVPWLLLFAVLLFTIQPWFYDKLKKRFKRKNSQQDIRIIIFIGLGLIPLAIYGGYFGAGFGFVMLAFLGFTELHSFVHRMNAVKNLLSVSITFVDIVLLFNSNLINWHIGIITAIGSSLGGYFGATYIQKVNTRIIRIAIIIIGLAATIYLLVTS